MRTSYLQSTPLALVLAVFLLVPIATIVVVSFWDYNEYELIPGFVLTNYVDALGSATTWRTYVATIRFALTVWAFTLGIGFTVAYFLAFHVRSTLWQMLLFQLCAIPFLTSNIIRMISWIPFLGRNGILNQTLAGAAPHQTIRSSSCCSRTSPSCSPSCISTRCSWSCPIFNTLMRIDRRLIEAARDAGAGAWATLRDVVVPLALPGIAIGTIFVVTLVMGDFITVRLMSGGQSASVGLMMANEIGLLQYPAAAAHAVVLLATVLLMVWGILRVVDIRREL